MNGAIRQFAFFLVLGLCASRTALAQVPDPARSSIPSFILVVGTVDNGAAPDPAGAATVVVRDFANIPRPDVKVVIDFSGCCDIALCPYDLPGQTIDCASRTVSGFTDAQGRFTFTALGAARDPGTSMPPAQYGGCGSSGVRVWIDPPEGATVLGNTTAACLDLNGAAGGSNGTTGADVANLANLYGSVALGSPYKGRGDINLNGAITGADLAALAAHVGRLALVAGSGCPGKPCAGTGCP